MFSSFFGKQPTLKGKNEFSVFFTFPFDCSLFVRVNLNTNESSLKILRMTLMFISFISQQLVSIELYSLISFSEQQRENDRALRKAGRDIERERRKLEDEEKKIVIF